MRPHGFLLLVLARCGGVAADVDAGAADATTADGSTSDAPVGGCSKTCAGCCMPDGGCNLDMQQACGSQGESCETCPDGGWSCKGFCFEGVQNCGKDNCAGCCFDTTVCALGNQNGGCGSNGEPCATCDTSAGEHCAPTDAGFSCGAGATCDGTSCAGCCSGDICAVGNQDVACGAGGAACTDCTFMANDHCIGGQCIEQWDD